jgi:hypothetical protein
MPFEDFDIGNFQGAHSQFHTKVVRSARLSAEAASYTRSAPS